MSIVASHLRSRDTGLVIWFAATRELLEQAAAEFELTWKAVGDRPIECVRFWSDYNPLVDEVIDGIVVAGLAKVHAFGKERQRLWNLGDRTSMVVFDEAHQAVARTYQDMVETVVTRNPRTPLLGLSATPGRTWADPETDAAVAALFYGNKVTIDFDGENPIRRLTEEGYLAAVDFSLLNVEPGLKLSDADRAAVSTALDIPEALAARLGEDEQRNLRILQRLIELADTHIRILVFAPSVANALLLASLCRGVGLHADAVTGMTDVNDRTRAIQRFKRSDGRKRVLVNFGVLTTGFDAPAASAAVIARPTKSLVLYSQMVGRVIRGPRAGGTERCEIVTVVDTTLPGFGNVAEAFMNWEDVWEPRIVDTQPVQEELDFSIVSANLTIEAMRDSGYKSTDHALAELIDNSVEADATVVEIVSVETPADPDQRYARARITEIAVSDDGEGMDRQTLRRALKFGDGTRLDRSQRGIGRFGVGLPQSTVSQCRRVDVWTWQNGSDNALHCYLDLDKIRAKGQQVVPAPTNVPVPDRWKDVLGTVHESTGTLVVWSQLDRVRWRGGRKTLERTAELCGRIYRKFLTDAQNPLSIDLKAVTDEGGQLTVGSEEPCLPNDPLYLMSPSSTPAPFNDIAMFEMFNERTWTVPVGDKEGQIHVRCTLAKIDAINEGESAVVWPSSYKNPGDSDWGKHAERNKGISIVRARRELEVSLAWVNNYEPTERWWSVEVEFDPILDDIFGVVNNKQHAHLFRQRCWCRREGTQG